MNEITMGDITAEVERVLNEKNVVTKSTMGAIGTGVMIVGGYVVVRRWVDRRIKRQIRKNEK